MSIQKFNPVISGELIPYTQVNTHVLQNIDDIEAGFIWIYLLSLPRDWHVVKEHVKKKFNIGTKKLKNIFAYLNRCKLIEYEQKRLANGRMDFGEIRVLNGSNFVKANDDIYTGGSESEPAVSTGGSIYRPAVDGTSGKATTTNEIDNKQNKKQNKYSPLAIKIPLPDWLPEQLWQDFVNHRKNLKAPLTQRASELAINTLKKFREKGQNVQDIINQSILSGWKGLFAIKGNHGGSYGNKRQTASSILFDSCRGGLSGTIFDTGDKTEIDPFNKKSD